MKTLLVPFLLLLCHLASAQYYYKDLLGTKESADIIQAYKNNKVARVVVASYDADNTRSDDFFVEQQYLPAQGLLKTTTRSNAAEASTLLSYTDGEGRVVKTIDSSDNLVSITEYGYDNEGRLLTIRSSSTDTTKRINEVEVHQWQYNNGKPASMLRIKNGLDTTFVTLTIDDKGNVTEEKTVRKGIKGEPVYYYYDSNNRLTDIVRFSNKAKRLLPEYMFEYSPANKVIQKITVPANSSDYLIWRYQYDAGGLKTKEAIYDKHKSLTGKIEYQYQKG